MDKKLIITEIKEDLMLFAYNNFCFDVKDMEKINIFCEEILKNV